MPAAVVNILGDVHLGGRVKSPYDPAVAGGYHEYYGEDDLQQDWWEGPDYAGYDGGMAGGYYDEYSEHIAGEWDHFEVDLHNMVFNLDDNLDPQELYQGFDLDQKSLVFTLLEEDMEDQIPAAWKSRPLKIHPEPASRMERKDSHASHASSMSPISTASGPAVLLPSGLSGGDAASAGSTPKLVTHPSDTTEVATPMGPGSPTLTAAEGPSLSSPGKTPETAGAPPAGSQSPKIFISDVQLEHLKKKMEFLKQKRSTGTGLPAMELPPAHTTENGSRESAGEDGRKKNKDSLPCTSNCPGGHGLSLFRTPDDGWWCSICQRPHSKDSNFFGCRTCDYDECEKCARAPVKKGSEAAAKSKKSSKASPRASSASSQEKRRDSTPPSRAATPPSSPMSQKSAVRKRKKKHRDDKHEEKHPRKKEKTRDHEAKTPETRRDAAEKGRSGRSAGSTSIAATAIATTSTTGSRGKMSDSGSSSEEDYRPPASSSRRVARDRESKLVPRGRRHAEQPEHWRERSRQDSDKDDSPSPARAPNTGAALAAAVRNAAAGRRPTLTRRAPPPERAPPSRASRSRERGSSQEPPPKKRASIDSGRASSMVADGAAGSSSASSVSLRAGGGGRELRGSPEAPRSLSAAATAPAAAATGGGRTRQGGDDLLRRVLRGNALQRKEAKPGGLSARGSPTSHGANTMKELPPQEEKNAGAMLKPPTPRERETSRAPNVMGGLRKALQEIASQEEGRGSRRAR